MADAPDEYTPSYYYDEAVGLPMPEGVYGTELHSTKSIATQITEAQLLLDLIKTQDPIQYANLTHTSAPMSVLPTQAMFHGCHASMLKSGNSHSQEWSKRGYAMTLEMK